MHQRKCENCRQLYEGQYYHDTEHAELVCTGCGCCQRRYLSENIQHSYTDAKSINPIYTVKSVNGTDLNKKAKLITRMTNRFCKEENAEYTRNEKIKEYAYLLDANQIVIDKCEYYFSKFESLRIRRPKNPTIVATLLVAKRECGIFVDVSDVSSLLMMGDLGAHVIAVCKIIGISQRSKITTNLPYLNDLLGFPYKYVHHIKRLYNVFSKENGSMATNTVMALVLWRFYNANKSKSKRKEDLTLDELAKNTGTTVSTLEGYMYNGTCTIYPSPKPKKRKRDS